MDLFEYYPEIAKKKIPLSLLGISSRVYSNWKKEGLLYNSTEEIVEFESKRQWVYLNVFDALWLSIIAELRNLNLDLETIRELKEFLFSNVELDVNKIDSISKEDFVDSIINYFPAEQKDTAKQLLMTTDIFSQLDEIINSEMGYFLKKISSLLFSVLVRGIAVSIVVKKSSEYLEFLIVNQEKAVSLEEKEKNYAFYSDQFANSTFINIPITPLLHNLFENENFDTYSFDYGLYTKAEKSILTALNDDDVKEIKISKHTSGTMTLNVSSQKDIKDKSARELRKIIGLKKYEKIEVVYRNEKHLIVTNTRKEIIEK
ncbi:hypothetical protein [Flavobacterium sp. W22_SRS_FP1]|uniref:hypothetical protein n=1 Tax=Flavobacterium sp. W22_SRS_FP1 TaxID=3240276 RepID=UPI003F8FD082